MRYSFIPFKLWWLHGKHAVGTRKLRTISVFASREKKIWKAYDETEIKLKVTLWPTARQGLGHSFWGPWPFFVLITFRQLLSCGRVPSLTRGRVCGLQLLLELSSLVVQGSESSGIRNHILLSQIWDPQYSGPYSLIYFPLEQGSLVISPGLVFKKKDERLARCSN